MSILIKGEKMPTGCFGCLLICQRWAGDKWKYKCKVSGKSVNVNNNVRPSDCPLVEIPPHGRLVDASEMAIKLSCRDIDIATIKNLHELLMETPTVIEGEK